MEENKENNHSISKFMNPLQPSPMFNPDGVNISINNQSVDSGGEKAANERPQFEKTANSMNTDESFDSSRPSSMMTTKDTSFTEGDAESNITPEIEDVGHSHAVAKDTNDIQRESQETINGESETRQETRGTEIPPESFASTLTDGKFSLDQIIHLLSLGYPNSIEQYSEHLFKVLSLLYEDSCLNQKQSNDLKEKLFELYNNLPYFIDYKNPIASKLYLVINKNFDILIKISINKDSNNLLLSTNSIRFLTNVIMSLNYWEIYNLLNWKPSIYHFLQIIQFNLNECYLKFLSDYSNFNYQQSTILYNRENVGSRSTKRVSQVLEEQENDKIRTQEFTETEYPPPKRQYRRQSQQSTRSSVDNTKENDDNDETNEADSTLINLINESGTLQFKGRVIGDPNNIQTMELLSLDGVSTGMVAQLDPNTNDSYTYPEGSGNRNSPEKKRLKVEPKHARKIIKRANSRLSTKSSNYDPDVVHECQLSSADEPNKLCLRRFSRKYELIRHQETVHSKKKKLFKCYVCVKQNPSIGPRIFTRHDTLAKHIRVNHKISGKEAKSEVSFSKKHAEIVEEGDITVHVGRRKTKVDFELRAHMERKRVAKEMGMTDEEFYERESEIQIDENKILMALEEEDIDGLDYDNLDDIEDMDTSTMSIDKKEVPGFKEAEPA